jgi:hypothetical protein
VLGRANEVIEYTFCSAAIEGRKVSLWVDVVEKGLVIFGEQ